jgi:hypothetical protein
MTPNQLVQAVANCTDISPETIVQHDRNLVVAGLRTKGGRGTSAAQVTHLDGARLLAAAMGSVRVKDSVNAVLDHENTAPDLLRCKGSLADLPIPEVASLPLDHNFVEALAAIVAGAERSKLSKGSDAGWQIFESIRVTVSYPWVRAVISFYDADPEYGDGKLICEMAYEPSVSRKHIPMRSKDDAEAYREWWKVESAERTRIDFYQAGFDIICIEQLRRLKGISLIMLAGAFLKGGLHPDSVEKVPKKKRARAGGSVEDET